MAYELWETRPSIRPPGSVFVLVVVVIPVVCVVLVEVLFVVIILHHDEPTVVDADDGRPLVLL
jgi:hypothetical protein